MDRSKLGLGSLRGTDSNSLLRLYDRTVQAARSACSQLERTRADKMRERVARELQRRNICL